MKPPPLLLGAGLLFWGSQTGLLIPGAIMALALEASRWAKVRWDFSEEDFSRIWIFCTLLFFASMVYAFTSNEGPSHFRDLFQSPTLSAQRGAGLVATHTAASHEEGFFLVQQLTNGAMADKNQMISAAVSIIDELPPGRGGRQRTRLCAGRGRKGGVAPDEHFRPLGGCHSGDQDRNRELQR